MKQVIHDISCISFKTWVVLCIFFLLLFDMVGYYINTFMGNNVHPFFLMEQIAPFIEGVVSHGNTTAGN